MGIYDRLQALADTLTDLGVPATIEPRSATVPGALVDLNEIGGDWTLCAETPATATVWLIVPDNGRREALRQLTELYARIEHLATGAEVAQLVLPDRSLPALRLAPITLEES